jgi:hypothetical protein
MDKKEFGKAIDESVLEGAKEPYPLWRRSRWDEWGSPVGLSLGWALFVIPLGVFLWLLHIAGLLR